jgi:hypothetical protein
MQSATSPILPKQFLVTRTRTAPKPGWQQFRLGDFYVSHAGGMGATRILHSGDKAYPETVVLGWFGFRDNFYPARETGDIQIHEPLENIYPEMTGRFVILRLQGDALLCTTDAGAQLPVVYRPETAELGSTPLTLGWTTALTKVPDLSGTFSRADGTIWYPFGATPYAGVQRLLPQQTVALSSGGARLVEWHPASRPPMSVSQMHSCARDFIQSLVKSQKGLECHLTAGWDSRMVLSASWPLKHSINYLTYLAEGSTAQVDAEVATNIARRFDLNHVTSPVSRPSKDDIDQWLARNAGCIHDSVADLTRTIVETYANRYGLAGVGGEVGRAFYWKKRDIGLVGLTPELLLERLGFGETREALSLADRWLARYRHEPRTHILDRAYIEIRLGCWAGPSLGGHLVEKPTLSPFNCLWVYDSMLALPESYRLSGSFARDFVAQGCRDLANIPVNRPAGLRRIRNLPREAAQMLPKGAKVRLRRLLLSTASA